VVLIELTSRDEAFELGLQWSTLYPEGSPSRALIDKVMSTSYLVNIVANDFKDGSGIFDPFQLGVDKAGADANGVSVNGANGASAANGFTESVSSVVNGLKDTALSTKDTVLNAVNGLTNGQVNGQANGH